MRFLRSVRAVVPALTLAALLAACGSTSSATGGSGAASSSGSGTSASSGATGSGSSGSSGSSGGMTPYQVAQARVAEFLKPPSSTLPVTSTLTVPKKKLTIAYTWCAQVVCASIAQGIQEAAKAIGANFVAEHHEDTASTVGTAFNNALAANPSMVLTSGDPEQWYASQAAQLKAKHVPLVAWSIPTGYESSPFSANLITNDDYYFQGVLEADYIAVQTHDAGKVLWEGVPQYPVLASESQGFNWEIKRVCPKCTVTSVDFSVQQLIAGDNVQATVTALQQHPGISWMAAAFGGLVTPQVANAVKAAGFGSLKAIEQAGTQSNFQMIAAHQLDAADIGLPTDYLGWLAVNDGLLALDGKAIPKFKPPAYTSIPGHPDVLVAGLPTQIITASDVPTGSAGFTPIPGFQSQFKKLWGLG